MNQPTSAAEILASLQNMQAKQAQPLQPSPFSTDQPSTPFPPAASPFGAQAPAPTIPGFGQAVNPPTNPFGATAPDLGTQPQNSAGLSARLEPEPAAAPGPDLSNRHPKPVKRSKAELEAYVKQLEAQLGGAPTVSVQNTPTEPALSPQAEQLLAAYVQDTMETNAKVREACEAIVYQVKRMNGIQG